ncbi:MAG: heavy metal-associated domain-containing protein [Chitinophagaceae bacterium]|nr:heavy metal-associated domain-containing protein [Chitinophagaceae bacterium]
MKKISFLILFISALGIAATAQQKKPVTVRISTPGVQCESCKQRIEDYLKYEDGITKVMVNFRQHVVTVTYMADRTNIENIKTAIANVGYDADDVKADEEAYKKLPKICKRTEDGGHPKKH